MHYALHARGYLPPGGSSRTHHRSRSYSCGRRRPPSEGSSASNSRSHSRHYGRHHGRFLSRSPQRQRRYPRPPRGDDRDADVSTQEVPSPIGGMLTPIVQPPPDDKHSQVLVSTDDQIKSFVQAVAQKPGGFAVLFAAVEVAMVADDRCLSSGCNRKAREVAEEVSMPLFTDDPTVLTEQRVPPAHPSPDFPPAPPLVPNVELGLTSGLIIRHKDSVQVWTGAAHQPGQGLCHLLLHEHSHHCRTGAWPLMAPWQSAVLDECAY